MLQPLSQCGRLLELLIAGTLLRRRDADPVDEVKDNTMVVLGSGRDGVSRAAHRNMAGALVWRGLIPWLSLRLVGVVFHVPHIGIWLELWCEEG